MFIIGNIPNGMQDGKLFFFSTERYIPDGMWAPHSPAMSAVIANVMICFFIAILFVYVTIDAVRFKIP